MASLLKIAVFGAAGRMGQTVVDAVAAAPDMVVVAGVDYVSSDQDIPWFTDVSDAIETANPDVSIDFTVADAAARNALVAIESGVSPVIGTTGMSDAQVGAIHSAAETSTVGAFIAPNFAVGAVLMLSLIHISEPTRPY